MKIVVVGLGYVGLANATVLAQHNEVIGVDVLEERVNALNARKPLIVDKELSKFLKDRDLNLTGSRNLRAASQGADYVIVSTPHPWSRLSQTF